MVLQGRRPGVDPGPIPSRNHVLERRRRRQGLGDGVYVAARLEGLAEPGGVCISDLVHQGIRCKLDLSFDDLVPQRVKNIGEPMHAFRIRPDSPTRFPASEQNAAPPLPDKPSIAVLPFENMSGDPEDADERRD